MAGRKSRNPLWQHFTEPTPERAKSNIYKETQKKTDDAERADSAHPTVKQMFHVQRTKQNSDSGSKQRRTLIPEMAATDNQTSACVFL